MKYRIIDVRVSFGGALNNSVDKKSTNLGRYLSFVLDMPNAFLSSVNCEFIVENTNVISLIIYDIKEKSELEKHEYFQDAKLKNFRLGGFDNIGSIIT